MHKTQSHVQAQCFSSDLKSWSLKNSAGFKCHFGFCGCANKVQIKGATLCRLISKIPVSFTSINQMFIETWCNMMDWSRTVQYSRPQHRHELACPQLDTCCIYYNCCIVNDGFQSAVACVKAPLKYWTEVISVLVSELKKHFGWEVKHHQKTKN